VIAYDEVGGVADLPAGVTDEHGRGAYRLKKRRDKALFGYNLGPHSWKQFLHPPIITQFRAHREDGVFDVSISREPPPRYAFLGVRPCELAALAVQDRVFLGGPYTDPIYQARREPAFLVAVACQQASATCFCAAVGTGPLLPAGYDLALTEILEHKQHYFLLEIGSERGAEVAAQLPLAPVGDDEIAAAARATERARTQMERVAPLDGVREALAENYEHPRWEDVANRCMSCANCTMVCPTCFCTTIEDTTDLSGHEAERRRRWDSCFTADFSYIHGGSVRASVMSRYRQWLTHKLSTWHEQFGVTGCVGCGRCITWCPAAIDIREEAMAIAQSGAPEGVAAAPAVAPDAIFPEWRD